MLQFCILVNVLAIPLASHDITQCDDDTAQWSHKPIIARADRQWLRVMSLGASITFGQRGDANSSNDVSHNGYRKPLRDQLRSRGYQVNMIGCMSTGQMIDRQHEGHPGFLVSEVHEKVSCAIDQKPNLVLINAGTNDCIQGDSRGGLSFVQGTSDRMKEMIDDILSRSNGVTIILSTLLPNGNPTANNYVNVVNAGYRKLVSAYQSANKKVQLADMNTGFIKASELPDRTHPIDAGYKKMAAVWDQAITAAANKGWIINPINTGKPDDGARQCDPRPNGFTDATLTQRGSGWDDGTYAHASTSMGVVTTDFVHESSQSATAERWLKNYHFAQLVNAGGADRGAETDELIRVLDPEDPVADKGFPAVAYKTNNGGRYSSDWTKIDVKQNCKNRGVHWGDVNNDGLDDLICIGPEGNMYVSINRGGSPPTFDYIGKVRNAESYAPQARVRLGDIDGDGRIDYCAIKDQGDIYCWRNGGTGDVPVWQGMVGNGVAFDAKGMGDIQGIRFIDINGDSRADFVVMSPNGRSRIFINQRGTISDGGGLKPHWIEASKAHAGSSENLGLDHFKFGRIYGSGRADYIRVTESNVQDNLGWKHTYNFEIYKNTGSGGTKVKGDGVYYCDMFGRGHDDYLWVWESGAIHLFENSGKLPNWVAHNEIFNTGRNRKSIQFGDWDADGLCDILAVDRQTGAVDWWQNTWVAGKAVPTFTYKGRAIDGGCKQGWGVSRYDLGLRFADIDGDGRVDYLCLEANGRTTGYLNTEKGITNVGQIKFSVGKDRAEHRFADINSDGKADLLVVDKFTGDVSVYINEGQHGTPSASPTTSSFEWVQQDGLWMNGVDRGANMFFAKMSNSSGRVDFVRNLPATDIAYTYYNQACKDGGDDATSDLPLPKVP